MKQNVTFAGINALARYTSSPPAGGAVSLRLVSVAVPQAELRVLVPTGNQFNTAPLLRSPQRGRLSRVVPRGSPNKQALPRIPKLSPLCTPPQSLASPVLPVPRGFSGGGAALTSLCRRFPGGDIMNLTSRRNPLSGLSFSLFFFLRERKRGYQRRRSHKIPVTKAKPASPKHCSIVPQIPHPVNRASHTRSQYPPGLQSPSPCQAR